MKWYTIGKETYSKWFTLDFDDANASPKCGIATVVVKGLGKNGAVYKKPEAAESVPAYVNHHQELMINIEQASSNTVVNLVATTRGGKAAARPFHITVHAKDSAFEMPCEYTVAPSHGLILTQVSVPNQKVAEWKSAFEKAFTVASDDLEACPINTWYAYADYTDDESKETSADDQFKIWNAKVTKPMTVSYFYRVGDTA